MGEAVAPAVFAGGLMVARFAQSTLRTYLTEWSAEDSILLSLMPLQAQPLRSHALGFFIKRLHFLVAALALGLQLIVAAELLKRFFDGEFGRLCHSKPSYPNDRRPATPPTKSGPAASFDRQIRADDLKRSSEIDCV